MDDRIVKYTTRGNHIPLKCKNHPHLRWSTKNIAPLGCRSVFYDLFHVMEEPECECSLGCLVPLTEEEALGEMRSLVEERK